MSGTPGLAQIVEACGWELTIALVLPDRPLQFPVVLLYQLEVTTHLTLENL